MFFDKNNAVTKQINLSSPDAIMPNDGLNISYGIDRNFLYGCGISIASILKNNKNMHFSFHIFTDYFDEELECLFKDLAKQYCTKIKIYLVDCEQLKTLPSTKNWSYATYFRFIIADHFTSKLDKIIYMDADIICQGSLNELLTIQFNDEQVAAVVPERDCIWWEKRANALGIPNIKEGYFNAGFLLINLINWSKFDITMKALDLLSNDVVKEKLSFLDQDILNMLLTGKVIYLDKKYNTQYSLNYELQKNKKKNPITKDTILIHYIGPTKPWHEWASYNTALPFLDARKASPWENVPLIDAKSSNHLRYRAKHYFFKKKYVLGVTAYIKYLIKKIK